MKKILLIDDDEDFHASLKQSLEYEGYQVASAFNGKEGLKQLELEVPDLIITDIIMPEVDGMEFLYGIMKGKGNFPCKIIAISGGGRIAGNEYLSHAKITGVDAVFAKPLDMDDLLARLTELLS